MSLLHFQHYCKMTFVKKHFSAETIVVVMVAGMTDENGWQEIHQVTHTHMHTPTHSVKLCSLYNYDFCGCVFVGMSLWQRAALRAPAVLRR